jgi:hypothetical protein
MTERRTRCSLRRYRYCHTSTSWNLSSLSAEVIVSEIGIDMSKAAVHGNSQRGEILRRLFHPCPLRVIKGYLGRSPWLVGPDKRACRPEGFSLHAKSPMRSLSIDRSPQIGFGEVEPRGINNFEDFPQA